jgi:hypothetical protein
MKGGLEKVKASGIRMCGGKVGELLTRNGIETLGDIQAVTHSDLKQMGFSPQTAEWLKDLSVGLCDEEVKERNAPTTANAVKTFKRV